MKTNQFSYQAAPSKISILANSMHAWKKRNVCTGEGTRTRASNIMVYKALSMPHSFCIEPPITNARIKLTEEVIVMIEPVVSAESMIIFAYTASVTYGGIIFYIFASLFWKELGSIVFNVSTLLNTESSSIYTVKASALIPLETALGFSNYKFSVIIDAV